MNKNSVIRIPRKKGEGGEGKLVGNQYVRICLQKKYDLDSRIDITEFAVVENDGKFERGIYKVRTFGKGEVVVKVLKKPKDEAIQYFESLKNTHLSWQQDSSLGFHILKIHLMSKEPDFDETSGLLFVEFELARETLSQKIEKKQHYTEEERLKDFSSLVEVVSRLHHRGTEIERNFHGDLKPDNVFIVEHRNTDGRIADCLKIGDIEESYGTLPYRDFNGVTLHDLQEGILPPTTRKDDVMAVKMILLEMAFDFSLIDFCENLIGNDMALFEKFLMMNALERKAFIEKKIGKAKYFIEESLKKVMQGVSMSNSNKIMKPLEKRGEELPEQKGIKESRYWRNPGVIACIVLGSVFGIVAISFDLGEIFYFKYPAMYTLTHSIITGPEIRAIVFAIGVVMIGVSKDTKNRNKFGNLIIMNVAKDFFFAFFSFILIVYLFLFTIDLDGYRANCYLQNYSHFTAANGNIEKLPKNFKIPGIELLLSSGSNGVGVSLDFSIQKSENGSPYFLRIRACGIRMHANEVSREFIQENVRFLKIAVKKKIRHIEDIYDLRGYNIIKSQIVEFCSALNKMTGRDNNRFNEILTDIDADPPPLELMVLLHHLKSVWNLGDPDNLQIFVIDSITEIIEAKPK